MAALRRMMSAVVMGHPAVVFASMAQISEQRVSKDKNLKQKMIVTKEKGGPIGPPLALKITAAPDR
jgi:hypothetical protein